MERQQISGGEHVLQECYKQKILEAIETYMNTDGFKNGKIQIGSTTITLEFEPKYRCECGSTFAEERKMRQHRDGLLKKNGERQSPTQSHVTFMKLKEDSIITQNAIDNDDGKSDIPKLNLEYPNWSWLVNEPYKKLKKMYPHTTFELSPRTITPRLFGIDLE